MVTNYSYNEKGAIMRLLEVKNVNKFYMDGEKPFQALKNVNLMVDQGEFLAIVGPSGSGKSTLLNIIGGLDRYDSGQVFIEGKEYRNCRDREMSEFRRQKIGFIFQNFNLISVLNVYENIIFPIQLDGKKEDEVHIKSLLNELGILDKMKAYPAKLSGGQQQRVAIARALANDPSIILADEPTGSLDSDSGNAVLDLLCTNVKKNGKTLIIITHNMEIAQKADRIVYMKDGELYE